MVMMMLVVMMMVVMMKYLNVLAKKGGAACLPCIALLQLSMGGQVTNMIFDRMCELSIFEKKIFKYLSIISLDNDLTHSMQIFAGEKYQY